MPRARSSSAWVSGSSIREVPSGCTGPGTGRRPSRHRTRLSSHGSTPRGTKRPRAGASDEQRHPETVTALLPLTLWHCARPRPRRALTWSAVRVSRPSRIPERRGAVQCADPCDRVLGGRRDPAHADDRCRGRGDDQGPAAQALDGRQVGRQRPHLGGAAQLGQAVLRPYHWTSARRSWPAAGPPRGRPSRSGCLGRPSTRAPALGLAAAARGSWRGSCADRATSTAGLNQRRS